MQRNRCRPFAAALGLLILAVATPATAQTFYFCYFTGSDDSLRYYTDVLETDEARVDETATGIAFSSFLDPDKMRDYYASQGGRSGCTASTDRAYIDKQFAQLTEKGEGKQKAWPNPPIASRVADAPAAKGRITVVAGAPPKSAAELKAEAYAHQQELAVAQIKQAAADAAGKAEADRLLAQAFEKIKARGRGQ